MMASIILQTPIGPVMLSTMMVKGDELGWVLGDWFGGLNTGRWGCDHIILLPSYLPQAQQDLQSNP